MQVIKTLSFKATYSTKKKKKTRHGKSATIWGRFTCRDHADLDIPSMWPYIVFGPEDTNGVYDNSASGNWKQYYKKKHFQHIKTSLQTGFSLFSLKKRGHVYLNMFFFFKKS